MKRTSLAAGALAAFLTIGCVKETTQLSPTETTVARANSLAEEAQAEHTPDEVLIKFKSGTSQTGILNALARISGKVKEHVLTGAMRATGDNEGFYVVQVPLGVSVALEKIKGVNEVEYAEPNYIYSLPLPPSDVNDPYYSASDNLWGMMGDLTWPHKNHYASRAAEAWWDLQPDNDGDGLAEKGRTTPLIGFRDVYVAVIDQGVEHEHQEFIRPDGTNQIAVQYGKDFVSNDNDPSPNHATEDHGTHVAGTIGAMGNNSFGVAGVCWDVSIISVRFLDQNGYGTAANAAKALDYLTDLKRSGVNIVASNNSWGGLNSKALQAAINRSEQAGILFVVAAGNSNSNNDRRATYPSCYTNEGIVSVASITVDGTKSSFSSYGANTVDLAAPGSYIWSTVPVGSELDAARDGENNGIAHMSGTSMATPHVAGAIALYASAHNLKPATKAEAIAIKNMVLQSTRRTTSMEGKCSSNGRLDINRLIKQITTPTIAD